MTDTKTPTTPQLAPYWKRVLTMAGLVALGWKLTLPAAWRSLVFAFADFVVELFGFAVVLLLPLTFWLAPLLLWAAESKVAKDAAELAEFEAFLAKNYGGTE